jgi:hypothetical protein
MEATKKAAAWEDAEKAIRQAGINQLRNICQHLEIDFGLCFDKNDIIDLLLGGAVDPVYITEALRLLNASCTFSLSLTDTRQLHLLSPSCSRWENRMPSLPPPRAGPGASGARGESGPPPSPAAAGSGNVPPARDPHPPPPPPPPPHAAEASPSEVHMNTLYWIGKNDSERSYLTSF